MSSTHHSNLFFGFILTEKQAQLISKKIENEKSKLWVSSDEDSRHYYLEFLSVGKVDSYSYMTEIKKMTTLEKAEQVFDKDPFLKKNFKKKDIKLILMCEYY